MKIRDATPGDADAIVAIWNPLIKNTGVTFTSVPKTAPQVAALMAERQRGGHGFFVAEGGDGVLGFASYGPFRSGPGYAHTMEHTVIVAPSAKGHGTGRTLMARLEQHAGSHGAHSMIAGVSAENPDAIDFHLALGYRRTAIIPQAGQKFGRWIDLHLLQKFL